MLSSNGIKFSQVNFKENVSLLLFLHLEPKPNNILLLLLRCCHSFGFWRFPGAMSHLRNKNCSSMQFKTNKMFYLAIKTLLFQHFLLDCCYPRIERLNYHWNYLSSSSNRSFFIYWSALFSIIPQWKFFNCLENLASKLTQNFILLSHYSLKSEFFTASRKK